MQNKRLVDRLYIELDEQLQQYYYKPYTTKRKQEILDIIEETLNKYVSSSQAVYCHSKKTEYFDTPGSKDFFVTGDAPQPDNVSISETEFDVPILSINMYFQMPFFAQILYKKDAIYGNRVFVPSKRNMKLQLAILISAFMHELQHIKQYSRLTRYEYNDIKFDAKLLKARQYGFKADLVQPVAKYIKEYDDNDKKYRNYILDKLELESFAMQSVVEHYLFSGRKYSIPDQFIYRTTAPKKVYATFNNFKKNFGKEFGLEYTTI